MEEEVTEWHLHEALHVASLVSDLFDREIVEHHAIQNTPDLKAMAGIIGEQLAHLYQMIGAARFRD